MTTENGSGWTITGQQETTGQLDNGSFAEGVRISFRTAKGNTGNVFVPNAGLTAETARAAVANKAAQMDAISGLTG